MPTGAANRHASPPIGQSPLGRWAVSRSGNGGSAARIRPSPTHELHPCQLRDGVSAPAPRGAHQRRRDRHRRAPRSALLGRGRAVGMDHAAGRPDGCRMGSHRRRHPTGPGQPLTGSGLSAVQEQGPMGGGTARGASVGPGVGFHAAPPGYINGHVDRPRGESERRSAEPNRPPGQRPSRRAVLNVAAEARGSAG